ncbi:MAG TPA: DUF748 domain-containing protein [Candidatus Eisenbacteria bacterium]|nr:DUF748 domain-containing protein [Candidatus Eisenbacteria bacterium]
MSKRLLFLAALALFVAVWAADAMIASATSPRLTAALLRELNGKGNLRITFTRARLHALLLRLDADDVEIFETGAGIPERRVLYAAGAKANPDLFSWLRGRRWLGAVRLENADVRVVKDARGVFNLERILREAGPGEPPPLPGWKHQDWLFNLYERLKTAVGSGPRDEEPAFRIASVHLEGRAVLTDRRMKPIVLHDVEIEARGLNWFGDGTVGFDSIGIRGVFRGAKVGRFDAQVRRKKKALEAAVQLKNLDLAPLVPLYRSTSPVFFEKGWLTLVSKTTLEPGRVVSRNHLRLEDYKMLPVDSWSPESGTVLMALNRHPVLDLRFEVTGDPARPSFEGFVQALAQALEKDFDRRTLDMIRARARQEMDRIQTT